MEPNDVCTATWLYIALIDFGKSAIDSVSIEQLYSRQQRTEMNDTFGDKKHLLHCRLVFDIADDRKG
jgi:hypothetical protein